MAASTLPELLKRWIKLVWTPKCVGCAQGAYDSYIPEMRLVFEFEKGGSTAAIGIGDDGLFKRGDQRRKWATTACDGGEVGGKSWWWGWYEVGSKVGGGDAGTQIRRKHHTLFALASVGGGRGDPSSWRCRG